MKRLVNRLGRRGAILALLSVVYGLFGVRALVSPIPQTGHFVFYESIPHDLRAALWLVSASLGLAAALTRTHRDGYGFAGLLVPAVIVVVSYLWSFVGFLFGLTDWGLGWAQAGTWLAITALILIVSGWAEVLPAPEGHRVSVLVIEEEGVPSEPAH